jgi:hypothetical protein
MLRDSFMSHMNQHPPRTRAKKKPETFASGFLRSGVIALAVVPVPVAQYEPHVAFG